MLAYIRYLIRLIWTFIYRFRLLILLGIVMGIGAYFLLVNIGVKALIPSQKVGVVGRFRVEDLPPSILEEIGQGLTVLDENLQPKPALAESWTALEDGKTWEFKLADGKYWQDGREVKASDIVYEFEGLELERPDDQTLVFKLPEVFAPFPSIVARPVFKSGLLGTGQWQVKNIKHTAGIVSELQLETINEDQEKIYRFYPTEEDAITAFKLGELDVLQNIVKSDEFSDWPTVQVDHHEAEDSIVTLFFNTTDPLLADKSVRQALAYAIDKTTLGGTRALSPIQSSSWVYNPQVKEYLYDPQRALELLESLDASVDKSIDLVTISSLLPTAEKVADFWRTAGVDVEIHVSPSVPDNFQAFLTIYEPPKDPDQYTFWHSTQTQSNVTKLNSSRIDKLLEDGRLELNSQERRKIYLDFQRFLVEESPAVFLYNPNLTTISRKSLQN